MAVSLVFAILILPFILAIRQGLRLLKRAITMPKLFPEELALAFAWIYVVGSLIWFGAFLSNSTLLGFGAPWTWLAAAHFMFAGYGALTITALSCRIVESQCSLRILRILLIAHPITYLITAAGIYGFKYSDELGAFTYGIIFIAQLLAIIFGQPYRIARYPRSLLLIALAVPVVTIIPAIFWAWEIPILELPDMIKYHGIVNAVGHVGFGFIAFAWGRPQPHPIVSIQISETR